MSYKDYSDDIRLILQNVGTRMDAQFAMEHLIRFIQKEYYTEQTRYKEEINLLRMQH